MKTVKIPVDVHREAKMAAASAGENLVEFFRRVVRKEFVSQK